MIIGLTGSSGSGKSTVALMFERIGCHIVDCDAISRRIDGDAEYKALVRENFGDEVFDGSGNISRKKLGAVVFADRELMQKLSSISHPIIIKKVLRAVEKYKSIANVVIDAPLLFESGLDAVCDTTVGVIADDDIRVKRISLRDGVDEKNASRRASFQQNADFYRNRCIFIIENNGDERELEEKFAVLINKIGSEKFEH